MQYVDFIIPVDTTETHENFIRPSWLTDTLQHSNIWCEPHQVLFDHGILLVRHGSTITTKTGLDTFAKSTYLQTMLSRYAQDRRLRYNIVQKLHVKVI